MNSNEVRELLDKELLTIDEVSAILRVSWATASKMIGNGLDGVRINTSPKKVYWRITSSSVKRLLGIEDNTQVPA